MSPLRITARHGCGGCGSRRSMTEFQGANIGISSGKWVGRHHGPHRGKRGNPSWSMHVTRAREESLLHRRRLGWLSPGTGQPQLNRGRPSRIETERRVIGPARRRDYDTRATCPMSPQQNSRWATKPFAVGLLLMFVTACGDDSARTPTAPSPTTNRAPTPSGSIPAQTVAQGESVRLDVAQYFSDPDGDALTYEATSSDPQVAAISASGSTVSVAAENVGRADVTVSARDPQDETATQAFSVTVEAPTAFAALSGTVSDSRRRGLVLPGAVVRLEDGNLESMTTDSDGRYRFPSVSGTVTVTVERGPSYVSQTVEVTMDRDRTLDFALEHTGIPPFEGTAYITPALLRPSDATSLRRISYSGRGMREFWDRRTETWVLINAYLFEVRYAGPQLEFQVHPEFGSRRAARRKSTPTRPRWGGCRRFCCHEPERRKSVPSMNPSRAIPRWGFFTSTLATGRLSSATVTWKRCSCMKAGISHWIARTQTPPAGALPSGPTASSFPPTPATIPTEKTSPRASWRTSPYDIGRTG